MPIGLIVVIGITELKFDDIVPDLELSRICYSLM